MFTFRKNWFPKYFFHHSLLSNLNLPQVTADLQCGDNPQHLSQRECFLDTLSRSLWGQPPEEMEFQVFGKFQGCSKVRSSCPTYYLKFYNHNIIPFYLSRKCWLVLYLQPSAGLRKQTEAAGGRSAMKRNGRRMRRRKWWPNKAKRNKILFALEQSRPGLQPRRLSINSKRSVQAYLNI